MVLVTHVTCTGGFVRDVPVMGSDHVFVGFVGWGMLANQSGLYHSDFALV